MKKWLIALLFILVLLIAGIYLLIPSNLIVSDYIIISQLSEKNYKYLHHPGQWEKWWPGTTANKSHLPLQKNEIFFYKEYTYQFSPMIHDTIKVNLANKKSELNSKLFITFLAFDSIAVQWKLKFFTGINPVQKVIKYQQAKKIKNNMSTILDNLQKFLQKPNILYHLTIQQTTIKDSSLISTDSIYISYPSVSDVYFLINRLKKYIFRKGATAVNYPMLHIFRIDSIHFKAIVAIPTNKPLNSDGNIVFKRLVTGAPIITAQIKGGRPAIKYAHAQIEKYIHNYHLTKVAMPYEFLVTDRSKENDTSKWITKICYPVY